MSTAASRSIENNLQASDSTDIISLDLAARAKRLSQIKEYWMIYKGKHWNYDELDEDKPTVTQNKVKVILEKIATHATARAPYPVYYNDEVESLLHPYVKLLLDNSGGMELLAYSIFIMAAVTGDCFIKAFSDDGIVKLQIVESHLCDPYYDTLDNATVIPSMIEIRGFNYTRDVDDTGEITQKVVKTKEIWQGGTVKKYVDNKLSTKGSGKSILDYPPVVHIKNQSSSGIFGISDIEDLKDLNLLLDSALRGFQDIVDYISDPWLLMYGYGLDNVDKSSNRCLSAIPETARTELLEMKTDLPGVQKWIEYLNSGIHEQGGVPIDSTTGKQAMSNTSGTAYHYDMYPITEAVDRKILTHRTGINTAISIGLDLMYRLAKRVPNSPYSGLIGVVDKLNSIYAASEDPKVRLNKWNTINIEFADYLQKDELSRVNLVIQKYSANLLSRRSAMREIGVTNIIEEEKLIQEEKIKDKEIENLGVSLSKAVTSTELKSSSVYAADQNAQIDIQNEQIKKGSTNGTK